MISFPLNALRQDLQAAANTEKAAFFPRFFKTGPGQYGEGDQFLGITVPVQRRIARSHYRTISLEDARELLQSPIHEERLTALLILVLKYQKDPAQREAIYSLYINNAARVNNWDLVDSSAEHIVGAWLQDKDKSVLERLAGSDLVWERRIAMLATFHYIKQNDFEWPLRIAAMLVNDPHDLIQKAVGWMLREVGNRDLAAEEAFLATHYQTMPRTMLRYAIEKFPEVRRQAYLKGQV